MTRRTRRRVARLNPPVPFAALAGRLVLVNRDSSIQDRSSSQGTAAHLGPAFAGPSSFMHQPDTYVSQSVKATRRRHFGLNHATECLTLPLTYLLQSMGIISTQIGALKYLKVFQFHFDQNAE